MAFSDCFSRRILDFYLHEVSKYCMFQMFCGNWEKSPKYDSFLVPMSKVEEAVQLHHRMNGFLNI